MYLSESTALLRQFSSIRIFKKPLAVFIALGYLVAHLMLGFGPVFVSLVVLKTPEPFTPLMVSCLVVGITSGLAIIGVWREARWGLGLLFLSALMVLGISLSLGVSPNAMSVLTFGSVYLLALSLKKESFT